jgi:ribosomal protein S18 acetylase RimI-like enzyme
VLTVRPAREPDAAVLATVAAEAYRRYVPRIGREPAPMTADYAQAVRTGLTWVAEADGDIVGLLVLVVHPDHLLLENVAVLPSAQRRGVGARLLALAEDQARARGLDEIRLYTNEAMTENLAYYPRYGYTETHRAEQDGFRRVFFTKHLARRQSDLAGLGMYFP